MKLRLQHLIFLAAFSLLAACGSEEEMETSKVQEEQQTIAGNIPNAAGKTIAAQVYNVDRWLQLGQATIDPQGNFNIKLPQEAFVVQLVIDQSAVPVVLGGNDSIFVRTDFPNMMENFSLSNLKHADDLNKLIQLMGEFNTSFGDQMRRYRELPPGPDADRLLAGILQGKRRLESFSIDFIGKYPNSSVTQLMAMQLFPEMGLENWEMSYGDHLKKVLDAYQQSFPEARFTRGLESNINLWLESYEQSLRAEKRKAFYGSLDKDVNIGSQAPDIWMDKVDGGEMKLSDLKGQYVLIDFWASWCGPCRRENPNVVRLYKKYKDKGFTIFSVSLDDNASNWRSAIESDQLEWPHHVSDLMKWNSVVVQLYKFDGIPHTVLLDKKGTIIGKNLRGQELENKLKEIFGS